MNNKHKVIYFADMMVSGKYETIEEEYEGELKPKLKSEGIEFENVEFTESPPFGKSNFDIMFFDWGGMSLGNSCMDHYCRYIIKDAENNPSKLYCMVSRFTADAMSDALDTFKNVELHNVFLSVKDFCEYFKKYEQ